MKSLIICIMIIILTACSNLFKIGSTSKAHKFYNAGDYEKTLKMINQAEAASTNDPNTLAELSFLKAQTYEQLGNISEAKAIYQYVAEQHSGTQYGYQAKAWITEHQEK